MRTLLRTALLAAATAVAAPLLSSCYFDSYGYSPGYSSGTLLVSTSSSYWGYDPYRYCYYDYRKRCYYDPYLCGYYPVGHRPPPVVGCPHPHRWRPGHGVCPAPSNPRNHQLGRHLNRLHGLQGTSNSWANNVRPNNQSQHAHMRQHPSAWQNRVSVPVSTTVRPAGRVTAHGNRTGSTLATNGSRQGSQNSGSHRSGMRTGPVTFGSPGIIGSSSGSHRGNRGGPGTSHSSSASQMAAMQAQARAQATARANTAAASRAATASRAAAASRAPAAPHAAAATRTAAPPPPSYSPAPSAPAVRPSGRVPVRSGGGRRGR